jgi:HSP20 family molecular chaperone IbpA
MALPYIYNSPPYNTTFVHETFPTHHFPFDNSLHKISHTIGHNVGHAIKEYISPYGDNNMLTPLADVRETTKAFYVDIELPGLSSKDQLVVKWINAMTLHVNATIQRPKIEEDKREEVVGVEAAESVEGGTTKPTAGVPRDDAVHILIHDRRVGQFVRSFYFFVEVEQETMETMFSNGLLRIVVQKKPHEQKEVKSVHVDHLDK